MTGAAPSDDGPREAQEAQPDRLPLEGCRRSLARLWFVTPLPAVVVLLIRTMSPAQGEPAVTRPQDEWGWLMQMVLPTLTLIMGVMAANAIEGAESEQKVRHVSRWFYRMALGLSAFYLVLVDVVVFLLIDHSATLKTVTVAVLAPLQALLGAALGAFFVSAKAPKT
jgi:hypothetical protein